MTKKKREAQLLMKGIVRDIVLISAGVMAAAYGLKGFLLPNGFIDGGVTGISLLINRLTDFSLSISIFVINIPFIVLGYTQQSKGFALKTFVAITALALTVHFIDFPIATNDKLLVSVFGGFFLGLGIGLSVRGGCVIDGTEVLAIYSTRKSGLTIGDFILLINLVIFTCAAFLLTLETALYSILAYLAASKTVDYVIQGIEEYTGVTIISEKSDDIRKAIIHNMGRGVTIYKGKRGFGSHGHRNMDMDVVFTVITRLEITKLKAEIEKIDDQAFVVMHSINETRGGMIKKRPLH
jgi:uncharacterized membrane-anchored protein YitT (DUF2179 family)